MNNSSRSTLSAKPIIANDVIDAAAHVRELTATCVPLAQNSERKFFKDLHPTARLIVKLLSDRGSD